METNFNFKSQVCTDKIQSERLLALGLKKETADCHYPISILDGQPCGCVRIGNPSEQNYHAFPAWSLHRLIELTERCFYIGKTQDGYNEVIETIEYLIKEGCFNKECLEEKI